MKTKNLPNVLWLARSGARLFIQGLCLATEFAVCCVLAALLPAVSAQTVTTVARLGGDPNGFHPQAALVEGPDGAYYGTTAAGGPPNQGTVFKITSTGVLTTLHSFTGGADGSGPVAGLALGNDGNFYGTTPRGGGTGGQGTIFQITPDGVLATIYNFSALDSHLDNSDGASPEAALTLGPDGNFYGTTQGGGTNGDGTVFQVTPSGTLTSLHSFAGASPTDFYAPATRLILGNDGNFYGTAEGGSVNGGGVIYQVTPAGAVTLIYTFVGGDLPNELLLAGDGNFYGTQKLGGTKSAGIAYMLTPAGTFNLLHNFDPTVDGTGPIGALTQGADGNFYGATNLSGPDKYGTLFKMTPAGVVTVFYGFGFTSPQATTDGANPQAGLTLGTDGNFYGTTASGNFIHGGEPGFLVNGTIFAITPAGVLTTLFRCSSGGSGSLAELLELPNGNMIGTTVAGGTTNDGTIFGITPGSNAVTTVHSFNDDVDGSRPASALIFLPNSSAGAAHKARLGSDTSRPAGTSSSDEGGSAYGTTTQGGPEGGGTVYSGQQAPGDQGFGIFSGSGSVSPPPPEGKAIWKLVTPLVTLTPERTAAAPADTLLYGVTQKGGTNDLGSVFSYSTASGFTLLHPFTGPRDDGANPEAGLIAGSDGNYYGTTQFGGSNDSGTIFSVTAGGTVALLHSFAGTGDGAYPIAELVEASDGYLYGTTGAGTSSGGGATLFRVALDGGNFAVLHTFASPGDSSSQDGANPSAPLMQASDGKLYSTTAIGGANGGGTIYSVTLGGTYNQIYSFGLGDGYNPVSALIQASDGKLYGTTRNGGTGDAGIIYSMTLGQASSLLNISTRLNVLSGDNVLIGGFIITGATPKKVIIRGLGPSLGSSVGVVLADPVLELHYPDGSVLTNDNWKDTQQADVIATTIPPTNDLESAIVATLAPGAYTAILSGKDSGTGIGLVEAYDLDQTANSQLANISTRGFVDTGNNVMIGGFIVGGGSSTVVLRALGPSLSKQGVASALPDPNLELHNGDGTLFSSNDNWMDGPDKQTIMDEGLAPTDPSESAILAQLPAGAYTAIVSGVNNATGVGLVEVYNVQ